MVLALLCYIHAALVFRMDIQGQKLIHACLHGLALVFGLVGVIAVFSFHHSLSIPNLYSLHSWMGLSLCVVFVLQYILAFVAFFKPGFEASSRARFLPWHKLVGIKLVSLLSLAVILTGIQEKTNFTGVCSPVVTATCQVANWLGLCVFCMMVTFTLQFS